MDTQAKHTPGPWTSVLIHPQAILNSYRQCFLEIRLDNGPCITNEEFTANCRLIAAAPDLLAACEDAAYIIRGGDPDKKLEPWARDLCRKLESAIAKARQ